MNSVHKKLGEILVSWGVISRLQLSIALLAQERSHKRLGRILVEKGFASEEQIVQCLASQFGYDVIDPSKVVLSDEAREQLPFEVARTIIALPLEVTESEFVCAVAEPLDLATTDEILRRAGKRVRLKLAAESALRQAIQRCYATVSSSDSEAASSYRIPNRFLDARYRSSSGDVRWFSCFDAVLEREVCLSSIPLGSPSGAAYLSFVRWLGGVQADRVAAIDDCFEDHGFRWTVFEPLGGESLQDSVNRGARFVWQDLTIAMAGLCESIADHPCGHLSASNIVVQEYRAWLAPLSIVSAREDLKAVGELLEIALRSTDAWDLGLRDLVARTSAHSPKRFVSLRSFAGALRAWGKGAQFGGIQHSLERQQLLNHAATKDSSTAIARFFAHYRSRRAA